MKNNEEKRKYNHVLLFDQPFALGELVAFLKGINQTKT